MASIIKEQINKQAKSLKEKLGVSNDFALPKIEKVVINAGTGKHPDRKRNELVADRLAKITGQKAAARPSKKSIATFKLREGDIIGQAITLRGDRMYDFLDRFIHIAMPRTRDFKGYDEKSIDEMGNLTVGVREHTIFPETSDEELKDVFGFSVTVVTTAKNKKEAKALFEAIGFPFKKKIAA